MKEKMVGIGYWSLYIRFTSYETKVVGIGYRSIYIRFEPTYEL